MKVRDGMTRVVLTIGPAHTLREAARLMSARRVGAAVVTDDQHAGIGILTERDILDSLGGSQDPDRELAAEHRTTDVVFASPDWTLQQAAETMVQASGTSWSSRAGRSSGSCRCATSCASGPTPPRRWRGHRRPHQPEPARIPRSPA